MLRRTHQYIVARRVPLGGYGYDTLEGFSLKGIVKGIGKIGTNVGKTVKKAVSDTAKQTVRTAKQIEKAAPYIATGAALYFGGPALAAGAGKLLGVVKGGTKKLLKSGTAPAQPQQAPEVPMTAGGGAVEPMYYQATDQGVPSVAPASFGTGGGGGGGGLPTGGGGGGLPTPSVDMASMGLPSGSSSMLPLAIAGAALFFLSQRKRS
jgi:hypothetical protein